RSPRRLMGRRARCTWVSGQKCRCRTKHPRHRVCGASRVGATITRDTIAGMDLSPKNIGRGGGVVLTVVGGLLTLVGVVMMSSTGEGGVDRFGNAAGGPVHLAVLMLGLVLALIGVLAIRSAPRGPKQVMTRAEALAQLATHPLPFWICARCHFFM